MVFLITTDPELWHSREPKMSVRRFKKNTAALTLRTSLQQLDSLEKKDESEYKCERLVEWVSLDDGFHTNQLWC